VDCLADGASRVNIPELECYLGWLTLYMDLQAAGFTNEELGFEFSQGQMFISCAQTLE
jgi:hypothetical protein